METYCAPLRAGMEAGDVDAVVDTFAPNAVLRSPLTARLTFTGHEQIRPLTEVLLEALQDFRYTDEACSGSSGFLAWSARIGGEPISGIDQIRFGADGKIEEFTVYFRPLPATARALQVIGTGLARRKSPALGMVISGLASPLAFMARAGDPVGVWLIRSAL